MTALVAIPPGCVSTLRPLLKPFVERAIVAGQAKPAPLETEKVAELTEALLLKAEQTTTVCLAVTEEYRPLDHAIDAVAMVSLVSAVINDAPEPTKVLLVDTLAGANMDKWLDAILLPALDELAREQGAEGIAAVGRPGWQKVLAAQGWYQVEVDGAPWAMFKPVAPEVAPVDPAPAPAPVTLN